MKIWWEGEQREIPAPWLKSYKATSKVNSLARVQEQSASWLPLHLQGSPIIDSLPSPLPGKWAGHQWSVGSYWKAAAIKDRPLPCNDGRAEECFPPSCHSPQHCSQSRSSCQDSTVAEWGPKLLQWQNSQSCSTAGWQNSQAAGEDDEGVKARVSNLHCPMNWGSPVLFKVWWEMVSLFEQSQNETRLFTWLWLPDSSGYWVSYRRSRHSPFLPRLEGLGRVEYGGIPRDHLAACNWTGTRNQQSCCFKSKQFVAELLGFFFPVTNCLNACLFIFYAKKKALFLAQMLGPVLQLYFF